MAEERLVKTTALAEPTHPEHLTAAQVADRLQVREKDVWDWINSGHLRAVDQHRPPGRFVTEMDLAKLLKKCYRPAKPIPEAKPRSVYFVQARTGGPIKIGVAVDPASRLREIQGGNPEDLVLLIADPLLNEREVHARFQADRIRGEWFRPSDELLAFIATVKEDLA